MHCKKWWSSYHTANMSVGSYPSQCDEQSLSSLHSLVAWRSDIRVLSVCNYAHSRNYLRSRLSSLYCLITATWFFKRNNGDALCRIKGNCWWPVDTYASFQQHYSSRRNRKMMVHEIPGSDFSDAMWRPWARWISARATSSFFPLGFFYPILLALWPAVGYRIFRR